MAEVKEHEKGAELIIDPKEVPEGACHLKKWAGKKVSVCKEDGKIKIFEVVKEE